MVHDGSERRGGNDGARLIPRSGQSGPADGGRDGTGGGSAGPSGKARQVRPRAASSGTDRGTAASSGRKKGGNRRQVGSGSGRRASPTTTPAASSSQEATPIGVKGSTGEEATAGSGGGRKARGGGQAKRHRRSPSDQVVLSSAPVARGDRRAGRNRRRSPPQESSLDDSGVGRDGFNARLSRSPSDNPAMLMETPTGQRRGKHATSAGGQRNQVVVVYPGPSFEPRKLVVSAGTTVTWKLHPSFDESMIPREGVSVVCGSADFVTAGLEKARRGGMSHRFVRPGTHSYFVRGHQRQKGSVTVEVRTDVEITPPARRALARASPGSIASPPPPVPQGLGGAGGAAVSGNSPSGGSRGRRSDASGLATGRTKDPLPQRVTAAEQKSSGKGRRAQSSSSSRGERTRSRATRGSDSVGPSPSPSPTSMSVSAADSDDGQHTAGSVVVGPPTLIRNTGGRSGRLEADVAQTTEADAAAETAAERKRRKKKAQRQRRKARAASTDVVVEVRDAPSPAWVTVTEGQTVRFINRDHMVHMLEADDGSFTTPQLKQGMTFSHTFNTPGRVLYHCEIYRFVAGTVEVKPREGRGANPSATASDAQRSPPGTTEAMSPSAVAAVARGVSPVQPSEEDLEAVMSDIGSTIAASIGAASATKPRWRSHDQSDNSDSDDAGVVHVRRTRDGKGTVSPAEPRPAVAPREIRISPPGDSGSDSFASDTDEDGQDDPAQVGYESSSFASTTPSPTGPQFSAYEGPGTGARLLPAVSVPAATKGRQASRSTRQERRTDSDVGFRSTAQGQSSERNAAVEAAEAAAAAAALASMASATVDAPQALSEMASPASSSDGRRSTDAKTEDLGRRDEEPEGSEAATKSKRKKKRKKKTKAQKRREAAEAAEAPEAPEAPEAAKAPEAAARAKQEEAVQRSAKEEHAEVDVVPAAEVRSPAAPESKDEARAGAESDTKEEEFEDDDDDGMPPLMDDPDTDGDYEVEAEQPSLTGVVGHVAEEASVPVTTTPASLVSESKAQERTPEVNADAADLVSNESDVQFGFFDDGAGSQRSHGSSSSTEEEQASNSFGFFGSDDSDDDGRDVAEYRTETDGVGAQRQSGQERVTRFGDVDIGADTPAESTASLSGSDDDSSWADNVGVERVEHPEMRGVGVFPTAAVPVAAPVRVHPSPSPPPPGLAPRGLMHAGQAHPGVAAHGHPAGFARPPHAQLQPPRPGMMPMRGPPPRSMPVHPHDQPAMFRGAPHGGMVMQPSAPPPPPRGYAAHMPPMGTAATHQAPRPHPRHFAPERATPVPVAPLPPQPAARITPTVSEPATSPVGAATPPTMSPQAMGADIMRMIGKQAPVTPPPAERPVAEPLPSPCGVPETVIRDGRFDEQAGLAMLSHRQAVLLQLGARSGVAVGIDSCWVAPGPPPLQSLWWSEQ